MPLLKSILPNKATACFGAFLTTALCSLPVLSASSVDDVIHDELYDGIHYGTDGIHHEEGSSGLPQFDPESFSTQIFWLFVFFSILYIVFKNRTLPEISSVIENRIRHIDNDLETAKSLKEKSEQLKDEYESNLQSSKLQAAQIISDLEVSLQKDMLKAQQEYQDKVENDVNVLRVRLIDRKNDLLSNIDTIAADIAQTIAKDVFDINVTQKEAQIIAGSLQKQNIEKKAA